MFGDFCDNHGKTVGSMKEVVLGIGNTLKGDDGIGIYIVERIDKKQAKFTEIGRRVAAINCGTTPENYTSIIRKHNPDRLILIDAADMGLSPGSYRIIPPEKIEAVYVSTHSMALSLLISYVSEFCNDIVFIGVQPHKMDVGAALSSTVRRSGEHVANLVIEERLSEITTLGT